MIDIFIVLIYFLVVFLSAFSFKSKNMTSEEYFLSSRNLKWPSIAISTIATNIQGYQFLGMMGSAYLFGIAQASLEINAIQGLFIAAFIFVPFFLKEKIFTISQFIKIKLGKSLSYTYSLTYLLFYSTITIGAALFWGAYAADAVFSQELSFISESRIIRIGILIIFLGFFSAIYTYFGGLSAVVKTDIIQFTILTLGGLLILGVTLYHLGGWNKLYELSPEKMHLFLPSDHEFLPWTHILGLFFLNINYWCGNQIVMQRSIAAKTLGHAQTGLMVGGLLKYLMALIIIIPGVALYNLNPELFSEPDIAYPYIIKNYIPVGLKGIILCGLFASLMSTVDSTFNSIATLWSIDIYSQFINKRATSLEQINAGKKSIIGSLFSGLTMSFIFLNIKFNSPEIAFTHTLNELRYVIFTGLILLICLTILLIKPKSKTILICFVSTMVTYIFIKVLFPEINYFLRTFISVSIWLLISILININRLNSFKNIFVYHSIKHRNFGLAVLISLIIVNIIFR